MIYKIKAKVWMTPGKAAWYFVSIEKDLADEIKANQWFIRRGFGSVPVPIRVGKTEWKTSIFPIKTGEYILPLKSEVRKTEEIKVDDEITLRIDVEF